MGSRGDSRAGRVPKSQRLRETPETQNTGRKGKGREYRGCGGRDARDAERHGDTGMGGVEVGRADGNMKAERGTKEQRHSKR